MPKQVTAYEANDGTLFKDEDAAIKHDTYDFEEWYHDGNEMDDGWGGVDCSLVESWLLVNKHFLLTYLNQRKD